MDEKWINVIIGLLGGGGLVGAGTLLLNRKKIEAEARSINVTAELKISEAAMDMLDDVRKELALSRSRQAELEEEMAKIRKENRVLREENKELRKMINKISIECPKCPIIK